MSRRDADASHFARLGSALFAEGKVGEAIEAYRQALSSKPEFPKALNNLASVYLAVADYVQAEQCYREALAYQPDYAQAHSNLLILLHYAPGVRAEQLAAEHREWARRHAPVPPEPPPPVELGGRRVRIGYVSADYHQASPVHRFIVPLLAGHDRRRVEIFCYSNSGIDDTATTRMRLLSDHWRRIDALEDEQVETLISLDGIDVLVDLTGHFAGNRLLVFARRPAPVQITYLGYPDTTGLTAIQGRVTDGVADPPGAADHHSAERLIRLPHCHLCFEPPRHIEPSASEAQGSGITFGSFNYRPKITGRVVAVWSAILRRLPFARLLLHRKDLDAPEIRLLLMEQFHRAGAPLDRIDFQPRIASYQRHLGLYRRIDVALDPFPYNGVTTTVEALWMGVPVVALAGALHVSRLSASLLAACGAEKLIAHSEDEYVEIAVRLAREHQWRRQIAAGLRPALEAASLTRPSLFVPALEAQYFALLEGL